MQHGSKHDRCDVVEVVEIDGGAGQDEEDPERRAFASACIRASTSVNRTTPIAEIRTSIAPSSARSSPITASAPR